MRTDFEVFETGEASVGIITGEERNRILTEDEVREELVKLYAWAWGEWIKQAMGEHSEWNQSTWANIEACGTTCCIAGKAFIQAGGRPTRSASAWIHGDPEENKTVGIGSWAMRRLSGLPDEEGYDRRYQQISSLFGGENGLRQVRENIERRIGVDPHKVVKAKLKALQKEYDEADE